MEFMEKIPTHESLWRSVILFGRNVATYKFALGKSLLELAEKEKTFITLEELAAPFSHHICEHIKSVDKQGTFGKSKFLDACRRYNSKEITKDELIAVTAKSGFVNVIDAFHIVGKGEIPKRFFIDERRHRNGIAVTDDMLKLKERIQFSNLPFEVEARWRLVETAWSLNLSPHLVVAKHDEDAGLIYVNDDSARRINVTSCRDSMNGYQKGKCFYCFRDIKIDSADRDYMADVDHFYPHILKAKQPDFPININGVWNLVLSCKECNRGRDGKFERIPDLTMLERLHTRNEYFIRSHHPLRETIINQTGATPEQRADFLNSMDSVSIASIPQRWKPPVEYGTIF